MVTGDVMREVNEGGGHSDQVSGDSGQRNH